MTLYGVTAAAAASAVSAGLAVVTGTVLTVRLLQPAAPPAGGPDFRFFYFLVFGTIAGLLVAGIIAWLLLAPVGSTYRRGGLAMVSAFATVLGMLVCMPVDGWFHQTGLAVLLAVCVAAALGFARLAHRGAAAVVASAP